MAVENQSPAVKELLHKLLRGKPVAYFKVNAGAVYVKVWTTPEGGLDWLEYRDRLEVRSNEGLMAVMFPDQVDAEVERVSEAAFNAATQ